MTLLGNNHLTLDLNQLIVFLHSPKAMKSKTPPSPVCWSWNELWLKKIHTTGIGSLLLSEHCREGATCVSFCLVVSCQLFSFLTVFRDSYQHVSFNPLLHKPVINPSSRIEYLSSDPEPNFGSFKQWWHSLWYNVVLKKCPNLWQLLTKIAIFWPLPASVSQFKFGPYFEASK